MNIPLILIITIFIIYLVFVFVVFAKFQNYKIKLGNTIFLVPILLIIKPLFKNEKLSNQFKQTGHRFLNFPDTAIELSQQIIKKHHQEPIQVTLKEIYHIIKD